MKNIHKTTKRHFSFYSNLASKVSDKDIKKFIERNSLSIGTLKRLYKKDQFLRNLSPFIFNRYIHPVCGEMEEELRESINACLWKFVLVFKVLGAEPKFLAEGNLFEASGA